MTKTRREVLMERKNALAAEARQLVNDTSPSGKERDGMMLFLSGLDLGLEVLIDIAHPLKAPIT